MPEAQTAPAITDDPTPDNLVEVGSYRTNAEGSHHGLVILAMEHPYWLVPTGDAVRLLVEPQIATAAREQLRCFDRESVGWPPVSPGGELVRETEVITPLLWSLIVLAVFRAQMEWPALTQAGALDSSALFERGEWWRLGTALFLHADPGHVISNALSGILVFSAVVSTLGKGRGWLLLALASLLGNLAAAGIKAGEAYRSLGASTAIFAGLGLLTGRAIRRAARSGHPHRWRAVFVPFAAGVTILALYGAGGVRIDVGAHVAGFAAGLLLGWIAGMGGRMKSGAKAV